MMKNSDIKETKDYSQFKVGDWNRTIKKNNLKKLEKSVKQNGWLKHPIMVNENMEIMDGQHRFVYAKENDLPVYYVVIQGLSANDCVTMNNIRTAWSLMDYINFYASQGNSDYIILQELAVKYQFIPPTTLISVIKTTVAGGSFLGQVKTGQFTITTKEHDRAVKKLDFLSDLSIHILGVPGRPTALFSSIAFAFDCPGIDKERLSRQIKNYIGIITPPANLDMALKEVERIYNYRNLRGDYIYIYTEYKKQASQRIAHGMKKEEE